jgi:hypothetical protein
MTLAIVIMLAAVLIDRDREQMEELKLRIRYMRGR